MKFNVRDNLPEYYEIHLFVEDDKYWAALLDENSTLIETLEAANEKIAIAKKTYQNSMLRLVRYSPYIVYATQQSAQPACSVCGDSGRSQTTLSAPDRES